MEEVILHIKLMNRPIPGMNQGENGIDSRWFDDGTECPIIVNAGALSESAKNPTSFVSVGRTTSMKLVSENPFASDHICVSRTLDEVPCVVVVKSSILVGIRVSQSITEGSWNWGEYLGVHANSWLKIPIFAAGRHAVRVDDRRDGNGTRREGRDSLDVAGRGRNEARASSRSVKRGLGATSGIDVEHWRLGEGRSRGRRGCRGGR
jgi:hypothetical protein